MEDGIRATGRTFRLDPIMISKSTWSLSLATALWNSSPSPSPKNTMSGFMMAGTGGGGGVADRKTSADSGPEVDVDAVTSGSDIDAGGGGGVILGGLSSGHSGHFGILCSKMSSRMTSAATLCLHLMQVAVANEPWHWTTFWIPTT